MIFAGRISQYLDQGGVGGSWVLWLIFYNFISEECHEFQNNEHLTSGNVFSRDMSHLAATVTMMEHDTNKQLVVACYTGNRAKEKLPLGAPEQSLSCPLHLKCMFPRKEHVSNIKAIKPPRCTNRFCNFFPLLIQKLD